MTAGNVWYTGNKNGTRRQARPGHGRRSPNTRCRTRRRRTRIRRCSTADGILWFTLQLSNMVGRLDPATGDIKLVTMKTPDARALRHQDRCRGHPVGRLQRQQLPRQGRSGDDGAYRGQAADPGDHGAAPRHRRRRHDLVRQLLAGPARPLRPARPARSRSGLRRAGRSRIPMRIAVVDGIVWYNESGMRPDALVRFDPRTETFQSWPIPSGGVHAGIIRHMRPTRGRQPPDPPEQHQPHHPGDAERPHTGALAGARRGSPQPGSCETT